MNRSFVFIFPGRDPYPMGGYKVIYEYANRLASNNFNVILVYAHLDLRLYKSYSFLLKIRKYLGYLIECVKINRSHSFGAGEWFQLDKRISKKYCFVYNSFFSRQFESYNNPLYFATAVQTAYFLSNLIDIPNNEKYYIIQDFEAWSYTAEDVMNSYLLPLKKICIAPWLQKLVIAAGSTSELIPNGLDFSYFKLITPIDERNPYSIAMLYHHDERKRCCDTIDALKIVKNKFPQLSVTAFGTLDRDSNLPEWFNYYKLPDKETHNKIYNEAAIFVAASKIEGMGLTPAESMMCGAALCCTDTTGFKLYAIDKKTALLSPICNPSLLADNIIKLLLNQSLRISIAKQGNEYIKQFTWENAYNHFVSYCTII